MNPMTVGPVGARYTLRLWYRNLLTVHYCLHTRSTAFIDNFALFRFFGKEYTRFVPENLSSCFCHVKPLPFWAIRRRRVSIGYFDTSS